MEEGLQKVIARSMHLHKERVRVHLDVLRTVVNAQLDAIVDTVDTMTSAFASELEETCKQYLAAQVAAAAHVVSIVSPPSGQPATVHELPVRELSMRELPVPATPAPAAPPLSPPPAPVKDKDKDQDKGKDEKEAELSDLVLEDMDIGSPPPSPARAPVPKSKTFEPPPQLTKDNWVAIKTYKKPLPVVAPKTKSKAKAKAKPIYVDVVSSSDSEAGGDADYKGGELILTSSSSSSSEEEEQEPQRKQKKKSAYRESDSDDDFVVDSSEEPPVYGAQEMFDWVAEQNEKDLRRRGGGGKRRREKRKLWSPSQHDHERIGQVENLADDMDNHMSKEDLRNLTSFIKDARDHGFATVMPTDLWYQRHFGKPLAGIRDNLGHQSPNNKAPELFDRLVAQCTSDEYRNPYVEKKRLGVPGTKTCCFCGDKKNCPQTLWLVNEAADGREEGETIAVCCSVLAQALIEFFKHLHFLKEDQHTLCEEDYKELERLFAQVQAAHADKGGNDRYKKAAR